MDTFSKNTEIQNFMIIRPLGMAELFHANRQTGWQTWRSQW